MSTDCDLSSEALVGAIFEMTDPDLICYFFSANCIFSAIFFCLAVFCCLCEGASAQRRTLSLASRRFISRLISSFFIFSHSSSDELDELEIAGRCANSFQIRNGWEM